MSRAQVSRVDGQADGALPPAKASIVALVQGSASMAASRIFVMGAGLALLPVMERGLPKQQFGIYAICTSLVVFSTFANLGLGSGLVTPVAEAIARGDRASVKHLVVLATKTLTIWASVLVALLIGIMAFLIARDGVGRSVGDAGRLAMFLALVLIVLDFPLSTIRSLRTALGQFAVNSLWSVVTACCQIVGSVLTLRHGGGLVACVVVYAGAIVLTDLINFGSWWMGFDRVLLVADAVRPSLTAYQLIKKGAAFSGLGLVGAVAYQSDLMIVGKLLGADAAADLVVPLRLFVSVSALFGVAMTPLWPAYSRLKTGRNPEIMARTLNWSLWVSISVNALTGGLLALATPMLVQRLFSHVSVPSLAMIGTLWLYLIVVGASQPYAMFMNGVGLVGTQLRLGAFMAAGNLLLSFVFVWKFGILGSIWATIVTQTVFVLLPCRVITTRWLTSQTRRTLHSAEIAAPVGIR